MSDNVRKLPQQCETEKREAVDTPAPDISTIMKMIREQVLSDVDAHRDVAPELSRLSARFVANSPFKQGDLQSSEELSYLNHQYAFETLITPEVVPTHRKGLLGKLVPRVKRLTKSVFRRFFLADYLRGEREFIEALVRLLNKVGRYVDARDDEIVRRIDYEVTRLDDERQSAMRSFNEGLKAATHDYTGRIAALDSLVRGLEGIVNNFGRYTDPRPPQASENHDPLPTPDTSYLLLENRYRGGEHEISRRISIYPEIFAGSQAPVLEIGPGRGELQALFKESGIASYGVDLDIVMVNFANSQGCNTTYGDGIAHLRSLDDASLGGIVAIQVVEHLTRSQIQELCSLATRKVKKGGRVVFETINPQSVLALSSNYFRDPTHVWPLHPDTLGYMATLAGLRIVETRYLSPVSVNHMLQELPKDASHSPAVADAISRINANMRQLNRLIYGFQDYALVLEVV